MAKNYLKSIDEKMDIIIESIRGNKTTLKTPIKAQGERFTDGGDGTISDKETGLMWAKEGSLDELNFKDAEKYCKELNLADHNDWRLPTLKELFSIADHEKSDPAIDPIFKCKSSWYWSSTPYAEDAGSAWMVNFSIGSTNWYYRDYSNYVRPVRQY